MEQNDNLNRIRIVLVDPQDGANIGSVCRAMKTMGIHHLAIVGERLYDEQRIKTLAVHAFDLYEQHLRFPSLEAALSDSVISVGTSRRRGKNRKYFTIHPDQLADRINATGEGIISIVFGREADGLTDAELAMCHLCVRIPTSPEFPSLNLSQAVQIITYTLFQRLKPMPGFQPITEERLLQLTNTIGDSFDRIGFYKLDERAEVERFFRDILARSTLSESESQRLEKMFIKMSRLKVHKEIPAGTGGGLDQESQTVS